MKVSRVYVRDTTLVSAYPLLLFGGDIKVQHLQKLLVVDNWIKYKVYKLICTRYTNSFVHGIQTNLMCSTSVLCLIKLITELIKYKVYKLIWWVVQVYYI